MLLELAKPVTLLCSILVLLAAFHAAFLGTEADIERRLLDSLPLLALAAIVSLLSGVAFRESAPSLHATPLSRTFPVQLFCWTTGIMLALFIVSWYLETHCIFYRNIHL